MDSFGKDLLLLVIAGLVVSNLVLLTIVSVAYFKPDRPKQFRVNLLMQGDVLQLTDPNGRGLYITLDKSLRDYLRTQIDLGGKAL